MSLSKNLLNILRNFALCHFLSGFLLFLFGIGVGLSNTVLLTIPFGCYAIAVYVSANDFVQIQWGSLWRDLARQPRFPLFVVFLFLILDILFCFLPPGEHIEADGLIYHLTIPWQYYLRKGVVEIPWSVNDKFPLYLQMAQLPFTVLTFPWIIKIWEIVAHPALLVVIWSWAKYLKYSTGQRVWILAWSSSLTLFAKQYGMAMFDVIGLVYILLGFFYLVEGCTNRFKDEIIWGAIFLSIACSAKIFFIYFSFVWFLAFWIARPQKKIWISFLPLLFAILWMLPVYIRNYCLVGNPIFPLFIEMLGPHVDNPVVLEVVKYSHSGIYGYGHSIFDFFLMPFRMVWPNGKFDYWTDPVLLLFLAAALSQCRRFWREGLGLVPLVVFFLYLFLFLGSQQARFFYPFWILVILLGGRAIFEWTGKRTLSVALFFQTILCVGSIFFFHRDAIAALKRGPITQYLSRVSFSYLWNQDIPQNIKTLCLRPIAGHSLKDFLYFKVPVVVVDHPNSVYSLSSKEQVVCDAYRIGSQFPPESIFTSDGRGVVVSREQFWDPDYLKNGPLK